VTRRGADGEHAARVATGQEGDRPPRPPLLVLASTVPATAGDGTPGFVEDLARALGDRYDVTVLAPRVDPAPAERTFPGGRVVRFGYLPRPWERLADGAILENLRARRWLWVQVPVLVLAETVAAWRELRRRQPTCVHAHWLLPQGLVAVLVAGRVPVVVTVHGADVYALTGRPLRALQSLVLRRAAWVVAVNADLRDRLVALDADPGRISVLPMGVDVDAVARSAAHRHAVPGRIAFVGRLVEKKGLQDLLAGLRAAPPDAPWSVDVVGDGPWRDRLQEQAVGLPVRFLGPLDHESALTVIADAEVVVVPSSASSSGDRDGLPVVLLEAMAAGKAVVATSVPGIEDVVRPGHDGLLVPPGDPAALASAVSDLLSDAELRARLGASAARTAGMHTVAATAASYATYFGRARA
jgi:glycosyltransferase involved in cell wall biosynthesis